MTDHMNNQILNAVFGGPPLPERNRLWFGLSSLSAGPLGTYREPVGNGYARASIANDATSFPPAYGSTKHCGVKIEWPIPTGRWGLIRAVFVADSPEGGHVLAIADITPRWIEQGQGASYLEPGRLVLSHR